MDRIISRNRVMVKLSIIALVLYVLYIGCRFLIGALDFDREQRMLHNVISNAFASVVLMIGYIAVYVLWTPDNEGNVRKRPTWQFVILIISSFVPKVISNIITYTQINMSSSDIFDFFSNANKAQMLNFLSRINYYSFVILKAAMLILLFIRSERRAKKIFIIYMISTLLSVVSAMIYPAIITINDYSLRNMWIEYTTYINWIIYLLLSFFDYYIYNRLYQI